MNNEAFRALVNQKRQDSGGGGGSRGVGGKHKSTREIAREAVQEEFRRRGGKRGRGGGKGRGGGGSDDDASSSDEEGARSKIKPADEGKDSNEPEWKRRRREKLGRQQHEQGQSEYRDRAKERREGTTSEYKSDNILGQLDEHDRKRQMELSKYLGGDEEHTHLVKGLDWALAQKVRREEMGQIDGPGGAGSDREDLDELLEDAYAQKLSEKKRSSDGLMGVDDWQRIKPMSELGHSVLNYLIKKRHCEKWQQDLKEQQSQNGRLQTMFHSVNRIKANPTVQKSLHRTTLTYSLNGDVRDRKRSWEVPCVSIGVVSSADNNDGIGGVSGISGDGFGVRKATPLDHRLLLSISKALGNGGDREKTLRGSKKGMAGKEKEGKAKQLPPLEGREVEGGNDGGRDSFDNDSVGSSSKLDTSKEDIDNDDSTANKEAVQTNETKPDSDDSDDDIFENVGKYVPDMPAEPSTTEKDGANKDNDETTQSNVTETDDNDIQNKSEPKSQAKSEIETNAETEMKKKQSIFDNLLPDTNDKPTNPPPRTKTMLASSTNQNRPHGTNKNQNKNVIDRDVIGSQSKHSSDYMKKRGPMTAAMEGVSMTSYQGGYGEEMDVDFGNFEEDRYKKKDKDKDEKGKGGMDRKEDDDEEN